MDGIKQKDSKPALFSTGGGTRTHKALSQGILNPRCLPISSRPHFTRHSFIYYLNKNILFESKKCFILMINFAVCVYESFILKLTNYDEAQPS